MPQRTIEPYRDRSLPERFLRWIEAGIRRRFASIPCYTEADGSPEGVIDGQKADRYFDTTANTIYYKTTDTGNTGWLALSSGTSSGGFAGLGIWRYRTATASTPAAGRLQFDNATIDSATELYVNEVNDGGTDMTAFLDLLESGNLIYIQIKDDATQFVVCEIGTPTKAAGVYTFPLTNVEGQGTAPTNNTETFFVMELGAGGGGYLALTATNRVIGSDAGASNTGDNVILMGSGAGDDNIADDVIAIGVLALNDAIQLDFANTIVIGHRAGQLLDDTRDPWLIIGTDAVAALPGGAFHDANTVIGHGALGAINSGNLQANTIIGFDAVADMLTGAISSSVVIGSDAGRGNNQASIGSCVVIGRDAAGALGAQGIQNAVLVGDDAGNSLSGAIRIVCLGSQCGPNITNHDECVYIGYSAAGFSSGASEANNIVIGSQAMGPATSIGSANILMGAFFATTGTTGFDHCIMMGSASGNDHPVQTDIFAIETPQAQTTGNIHPFLYGDMDRCNLALLSLADTSTGVESGTRLLPGWGGAVPAIPAGQGIFTLSDRGADPSAGVDTSFIHLFARNADNAFAVQFETGDRITLLHDGSDAIISSSANDISLQPFTGFVNVQGQLIDLDNSGASTATTIINRNSAGGVTLNVNATTGNAQIGQTSGAGAAENQWLTFARNGAVTLLHNDVAALRTYSLGAEVISPTSDNPALGFYQDDTTTRNAFIQAADVTPQLTIRSEMHGAVVALQGEDAGGTNRNIIAGDPDSNITFYHAGVAVMITRGDGVSLRGDGTDSVLNFENTGGTQIGFIRIFEAAAGAMEIRNSVNSGHVEISGDNSGGTNRLMIDADPDGQVHLHHPVTDVEVARTQSIANGSFMVDGGDGFEPVQAIVAQTDTELDDITDQINTGGRKRAGFMVWNLTQGIPVWAVSNADGSLWVDATGATANTPV